MHANSRFEEENVRNIIAFFNISSDKNRTSQYQRDRDTCGYDPEEFIAVAFIRNENGFSKSEDIKHIELPEVIRCTKKNARSLKDTPQKLRDRYLGEELQANVACNCNDPEIYIVIPEEGRQLKEGEFIYIDNFERIFGEVKMVTSVPDAWPTSDMDHERNGWQFILVERGTKTLESKATLSDIEPIAPTPGP